MAKNLIVILGPTASGKTTLAAQLAFDFNGEIISADSRQVYRNMNIGTGKDLNQYIVDGRRIPCHLIDVEEPENEFNVFEFQKRFYEIFNRLSEARKLPIVAGGTGLYLESVLAGYEMPLAAEDETFRSGLKSKPKEELQQILCSLKPGLHNRTDLEDMNRLIRAIEIERARVLKNNRHPEKPDIDAVVFGIKWERTVLRERITRRLEERLKEGMVEEVKNLHSAGLSWKKLDSFGLEYRFVSRYLRGEMTFNEMKDKLNTAIHQFAKRQETWFRRMERRGIAINWIGNGDYALLKEITRQYLQ